MHVLGVVGTGGVGATTTAVDLAAALRHEGHHAAVLDLTGDVAALFDVAAETTLADATREAGSAGDATVTVGLPNGDVGDAVAEYAEALGRDQTAFRAGDVTVDPGEPEPGELPVVVGGDRTVLGDADEGALSDVLGDLAFAFDFLVADAGTLGPAVARLPDGIVVVTDPSDESVTTVGKGIAACTDSGVAVVGAVVNRATDRTDVAAIRERVGADILAVIPDDDRTPDVEPIAFTAPDTPAALAYGRLAESVIAWATDADDGAGDGETRGEGVEEEGDPAVATDGDGAGQGDDGPDEDGDGGPDGDGEPDGDGGLFGRLTDRFR